MENLTKKATSGVLILAMALGIMMTAPFYADGQAEVQEISPLDLFCGETPREN